MNEDWMDRLATLLVRFPEYGIKDELPGLSVDELWGVYRFLETISESSET